MKFPPPPPEKPKPPTEFEARQFAIMLNAGLPAAEALVYFLPDASDPPVPEFVAGMLAKWQRSKLVQKAMSELLGKSWQEMSLEERRDRALDQHYSQQAYLLFSTHYITASPAEKGKLDTARQVLEAHKAGRSGQGSPLEQFYADIQAGKIMLGGRVADLAAKSAAEGV